MSPLSSAVLQLHAGLSKGVRFLGLAVAACRQGWRHVHSDSVGMTVLKASSDAAGANGMWPFLSLDVEEVDQTLGAWAAKPNCPVKNLTVGKVDRLVVKWLLSAACELFEFAVDGGAVCAPAPSTLRNEGFDRKGVGHLELLVHQGCSISSRLFYQLLQGCIVDKDLVLGRRVHALALESGYGCNLFLANHFIRMYASEGKLEEATLLFSEINGPDTFSWSYIILAHVDSGHHQRAIELYQQLRQSTVMPDNHIFVAVLNACASTEDLASGKQVHVDILGSLAEPDVFVGSSLVDMYAKCSSVQDARRVFDSVPSRNVVTWNAMLAGYAQVGLGQEALALYAGMQKQGVIADQVTFLSLLKAVNGMGSLHEGKVLHSEIKERGFEADEAVGSSLVHMYIRCGSLEDARRVFDRLPTRDVVTWNAMFAGYAQHALGEEAFSLYTRMQQEFHVPADRVTYLCLLKACASIGALQAGKELHLQIQGKQLESDKFIGNFLVDMYVKCGCLEDALRVFNRLPTKDTVTRAAVIAGYTEQGLDQEALTLWARMQRNGGNAPDRATLVCLVKACAKVGALGLGKALHCQMQQKGLVDADVHVGTSLVDMYAKCGSLQCARKVFDSLLIKNVVTWNALLNGYSQHNDGPMTRQCFAEMQRHGVNPDAVTFLCLLVACCREGLVYEGQQYFKMMREEYGIMPNASHLSCIVDLLGRSGRLGEAESLLLSMPVDDAIGWRSLLSACKLHRDVVRGERCFDRLVQMDTQDGAAYTIMSNIYAASGRWVDVDGIESLRKGAGACKKPARAWIEVNNEVHSFIVGEGRDDISRKLGSVNRQLGEEVSNVISSVAERVNDDTLCEHAEKLALAYGLLNTPKGATLIVTKNLRMCNDCHTGTKIMSRTERRTIVVRDTRSVHVFVDGSCSCGDRP